MADAKKTVQKLIEGEPVVMFSKSYCPYCSASKNLLNKLGYEFKVYELDKMANGSDIQDALEVVTGQRSVPNNFINGESIGGNSDLQSLHSSNKLEGLLIKAKAVKK
ncbi:Glutaredoxin-2 mitochondrial [Ceratocystis lukuohia]